MNKCEVCKKELPEGYEESICPRLRCKESYSAWEDLQKRANQYITFFKTHPPNDTSYQEYFRLANLEKSYQGFVNPEDGKPRQMSRRMWFHLNIGRSHEGIGWPDEFGRPFGA